MSKIKLRDLGVDPNNISGKKLAEIGRWALTGKELVENLKEDKIQLHDIEWLDNRIEEVCNKGRV